MNNYRISFIHFCFSLFPFCTPPSSPSLVVSCVSPLSSLCVELLFFLLLFSELSFFLLLFSATFALPSLSILVGLPLSRSVSCSDDASSCAYSSFSFSCMCQGGGALFVAIYILVLGMDAHSAVPLSKGKRHAKGNVQETSTDADPSCSSLAIESEVQRTAGRWDMGKRERK